MSVMRILYVDFNTTGHHSVYFRTISLIELIEPILVLPKRADEVDVRQYEISCLSRNMNLFQYKKVIREINAIIEKENPDIVHILSGDMLYRFFGYQLNRIKSPLIVTFHHMKFSFSKSISYRMIYRNIYCGVVHTEFIYQKLKNLGVSNAYHIEYPFLETIKSYNKKLLKKQFSIPDNRKVFLAFGETRYDKGLDFLLKALANIKEPFHLIIAGQPTEIAKEDIKRLTEDYKDKTTLILSYIDNETMCKIFAMSDTVVLPYRKKFAGASGPLTTAVAYGKMIIGPNINSIGDIIRRYHLGVTFDCENQKSLENSLKSSLLTEFKYDDYAKDYQAIISRDKFIENYKKVYMLRGKLIYK